jgi:hypothetical protein
MVKLEGGEFLLGTEDPIGFPADGEGPVRAVVLSRSGSSRLPSFRGQYRAPLCNRIGAIGAKKGRRSFRGPAMPAVCYCVEHVSLLASGLTNGECERYDWFWNFEKGPVVGRWSPDRAGP